MSPPSILLLDNYDSFVHNLARYFRNLKARTTVIRSDQIDVAGCRRLSPSAIVLSPGPKDPQSAGCCVDVIRDLGDTTPILGICLGHQSISTAYGGRIVRCGPVHGMASNVRHDGKNVFEGCPNPMTVGRYHSLAVAAEDVPTDLLVTAQTDDGTIMAVQHRVHPVYGLQFHPESVLTPQGSVTLSNFLSLALSFHSRSTPVTAPP